MASKIRLAAGWIDNFSTLRRALGAEIRAIPVWSRGCKWSGVQVVPMASESLAAFIATMAAPAQPQREPGQPGEALTPFSDVLADTETGDATDKGSEAGPGTEPPPEGVPIPVAIQVPLSVPLPLYVGPVGLRAAPQAGEETPQTPDGAAPVEAPIPQRPVRSIEFAPLVAGPEAVETARPAPDFVANVAEAPASLVQAVGQDIPHGQLDPVVAPMTTGVPVPPARPDGVPAESRSEGAAAVGTVSDPPPASELVELMPLVEGSPNVEPAPWTAPPVPLPDGAVTLPRIPPPAPADRTEVEGIPRLDPPVPAPAPDGAVTLSRIPPPAPADRMEAEALPRLDPPAPAPSPVRSAETATAPVVVQGVAVTAPIAEPAAQPESRRTTRRAVETQTDGPVFSVDRSMGPTPEYVAFTGRLVRTAPTETKVPAPPAPAGTAQAAPAMPEPTAAPIVTESSPREAQTAPDTLASDAGPQPMPQPAAVREASVVTTAPPAPPPASPEPRTRIEPPRPVHTVPEPPETPRTPVNTLSVTVGEGPTERTDIRFVHRNGAVEMAVRAANPDLARVLRDDLPELVRTLESRGYRPEIRAVAEAVRAEPLQTRESSFGERQWGGDRHSSSREDRYESDQTADERDRRSRRQYERKDDDD